MKEVWKSVVGFEGLYEVSNLGRVKSLSRPQRHRTGTMFLKNERVIKALPGRAFNGYTSIPLQRPCENQINVFLHRVVAEAFIPNPMKKQMVNHKNGIKTDNKAENLEWVTRSENAIHSFTIGLQDNKGANHPGAKLTEEDVLSIRIRYYLGESTYQIFNSKDYPISYTNVKDIVARRTWSHI